MEKTKVGLWYKEFEHNGEFKFNYQGKVKIEQPGEYFLNLYHNEKTAETQPDFQLYLKPKL